jgi:putative nucleotidyltransferase with HDIG domain
MNNNQRRWRQYISRIPHLFRYMLLGALVLFISLFFPNNIRLEYEFEQGDSWSYDDLRAPFSFPIKKSEVELEAERKKIAREFMPYYRLNSNVKAEQQENFVKLFAKEYTALKADTSIKKLEIDSANYTSFGLGLLEALYSKHIIKLDKSHQKRGGDFQFKLIEKQLELGEAQVVDFFTTKEATQIVVDTLEKLKAEFQYNELLLNILEDLIRTADIEYDASLTEKNKNFTLKSLSPVRGLVKAGEFIIRRGEIVDSLSYAKLISYEEKYDQEVNKHKNSFLIYFGYLILTIALLSIFAIFMRVYEQDVFNNLQHLGLIIALIAGYSYLSFNLTDFPAVTSYLIPFCIAPIIIKNFFSAQLALFSHIVIILIASMLLSLDYQFILVQIIVGMVAIMSKRKTRYLTGFFFSVLYIGIAYTACYLSLELIHKGAIAPALAEDGRIIEEGVNWATLGWIGMNICLTLLSYPLIPLLERAFGLISEITLVELSDLNKPLLKELSFNAPGTMQHSLQVANLAEAAATEVGANALLVKVGALYHDIGKTISPPHFIENQIQYNPHKEMTYLESAKMIISHVTEGIKLAKKYRLPSVLIDFIRTHHGTTRVEYFYRMHKKEFPNEPINESDFTYPGPRPRNREEAILMLADSIEAASKSLKTPTGQDIDKLVENIISFKISHGQLQDTDLTFEELDAVKKVFKKMLRSIHHVRIEYPDEQPTTLDKPKDALPEAKKEEEAKKEDKDPEEEKNKELEDKSSGKEPLAEEQDLKEDEKEEKD